MTQPFDFCCPHCGGKIDHIKIRTETETLTAGEVISRLRDAREGIGLRATYDAVLELRQRIEQELVRTGAEDLLSYPHNTPAATDYRTVQALAATYTLQEYLAGAIARAVAAGELDPDLEDAACYED